jgi:hypothetical protein
MTTSKFRVTVSYFERGELKKTLRDIVAPSAGMAWRAGVQLIPTDSFNQVQIKVQPVK